MSTQQHQHLERLRPGREFTVKGQGRYRVVRLRLNGEVNAWGPIAVNGNAPFGRMRTFTVEQITSVHRKIRGVVK